MRHEIGATFTADLGLLGLDPSQNYRRAAEDDPRLAELAQSMRELGQLQPVLVAYDASGALGLVAGFRRATAAAMLGWSTVRATVIDGDQADLARLAENFDRSNPTTYETSRYLYELATGAHGRRRSHGQLAQALGLSAAHIRNLVRVYRDAPPAVREAWEADRDHRFTFARLNALVVEAKRGEDFRGALEEILRPAPAPVPQAGAVAQGPGRRRRKDDAPKDAKGSTGASVGRRLGAAGAGRMAKALAAAGAERLQTDDRALLLLEVLSAVAGELPAAHVQRRVDEVLKDLGVVAAS